MDWNKQIGRLIGPLAFIALLAGGMAVDTHRPEGVEVAGDFTLSATEPRVLAVKRSSPSSSYVSFTIKEIRDAKAELSQVSFLLPEDTVHLQGGSVHRATVMERHADRQVVKYEYARGKWKTWLKYQAFKDRVEVIDGRVTNYGAAQYMIVPIAILALIGAVFAHRAWKFYLFVHYGPPSREKTVTLVAYGTIVASIVMIALWVWSIVR